MQKGHAKKEAVQSLQRKIINKLILAVAVAQPLGTIPQIITVFSTRNAASISISSWGIMLFFDVLWLWYGLVEKQRAVILSAVMFMATEGAVLAGALIYGGHW